MNEKFEIKKTGEEKFKSLYPMYYNDILKVYNMFDGMDYSQSSMGCEYSLYSKLIETILINKPNFILELGSGFTTYLMGSVIKNNNLNTKLLSLESEDVWFEWIKNNKLDLLDSVVKCNIKSWEENGKMFVKYIHDFEMNNVDLVFLDGPGHFNHEFDAGKCNIITHRWNKKCEESKKHIHEVKTSINYNYYDILVEQNKPVYCIIDGRPNTRSFYQDFLKEKKWDKMPMGKWEGVDTLQ